MAVALTATLQSGVYPPRVALAVTGLTTQSIIISRVVAGEYQQVRDAFLPEYSGTSYVAVDAELPFGVPVSYSLWVDGTEGVDVEGPTTYTLTGGKVAISDAVTGLSAEVAIMSWPTRTREREATIYKVGAKNFVVAGPLGQFEGDVELYCETDAANENLETLIEQATQGIVQIRQPGGYARVDSYCAVTSVQENRYSQDGTDDRRSWVLHVAETEPWDYDTQSTAAYTYQDVIDFYAPSGTYATLLADKASYLDVLTGDWA